MLIRNIYKLIVFILLITFLASCASVEDKFKKAKRRNDIYSYKNFIRKNPDSEYTPEAKKLLEILYSEEQNRISKISKLKDQYKKRLESGDTGPEKPKDFGHPLVLCRSPKLTGDMVAFKFPRSLIAKGGWFICANSEAGREIVKWRVWYCKPILSSGCVEGKWRNGAPTFLDVVKNPYNVKTRQGFFSYDVYRGF